MTDFKIPSQPANLFTMPIADEGDKAIITGLASRGRASIPAGFPLETQLPMREGGVAPNRLDFQGMFYMLSAFAFWQQSGGLFGYNSALNYVTPSVVYHNDVLWWCEIANGPATPDGAQEPGIETGGFWVTFFSKLAGGEPGGGGSIPVGGLLFYYGTQAPDGYLWLNGDPFSVTDYPLLAEHLGTNILPDYRGLFPRGYDPTAIRDPDGKTRALGSIQQDAMQNLWFQVDINNRNWVKTAGAIRWVGDFRGGPFDKDSGAYNGTYRMEAAYQVRTATETRGKNFSIMICIKHD